jgi:calcineurin-like phosphoesterase family protein
MNKTLKTKWVWSDPHFSHEAILGYCQRPFKNTKEMDSVLVKNHNQLVKPEDTVYCLGDFTMRGTDDKPWFKKTLKMLRGTKILILGNHDKLPALEYVELGFQSVHTSLVVDDIFLAHDPAWATAIPKDMLMMCGHVHGLFKLVERTHRVLNVGVDVWDYKPVSFEDALKCLTNGVPDSKIDVTDQNFKRHGDH